jgi:DNA-binding transcriptional ArsR family regulator
VNAVAVDEVFKALAEPKRREMLRLLRTEAMSVNEIASRFDITQQAVSLHLKVLRGAGLVTERRDGTRRLYLVRPEGLAGVNQFIDELWPAALGRLKSAVEARRDR